MASQACPNCQRVHDTSVYVSGQRLLCKCGIRFEVKRADASMVGRKPADPASVNASAAPTSDEVVDLVRTPLPPSPGPDGGGRRANTLVASDDPFGQTAIRLPTPPVSAAPLAPPTPEPPPRPEIPGYALIDLIGRGGMGEVWRARQVSLGRTVALKLLPEKLARDAEFVARFEKEATALATLSHPNIIQIIDRGSAGGHYYFAMEYVAGRSLRDVVNKGRLPPQEALKIIAQICRAIDYAHDQGIIHRDLKPENILIDERGHVKVADFGLAGIRGGQPGSGQNLTATAVAMGTLNYMAPEQRKDAKNVDGRADLYSLGVILYELLTGELPLGRFKLPSEKDAALDVRLDQIVVRTLETDPDARYARASQVGHDVEALISSVTALPPGSGLATPRPASAATTPSPTQHTSFVQKGWSAARYGLTVIGALSVAAFLVRGPLDRLWSGEEVPEVAREVPPNSNRSLRTAATEVLSSANDLAFVTSFDAPGEGTVQVLNANDGDWVISNGRLIAEQAGNVATKTKLRPRAFLSRRYFTTDDFSAEVRVQYGSLEKKYDVGEDVQVFSELGFRFAPSGVQVSVFAIPGTGVRLLWRYELPDGTEIAGNSANDLDALSLDEMAAPPMGAPFALRLSLKKHRDGTLAEAYLNGERVARKVLPGLFNETGKLALGCRSLHCEFDDLKITGKAVPRPKKTVASKDED